MQRILSPIQVVPGANILTLLQPSIHLQYHVPLLFYGYLKKTFGSGLQLSISFAVKGV
jgi:hypothetical protein